MDTSDYQEIRALFDEYIRMYSTRDDLLTTCFSEDFSGITGSGDYLVKDREAWIAVTRQDFAQVTDPINIELKDLAIQLLADTIAVTSSTFIIHLPIEEHILSKKIARLVLIFRKEDAGWKISHSSISVSFGVAHDGEIYPLKHLEDRNRQLEALVAERTGQLSEANENLMQANEDLAREIEERKKAEELLSYAISLTNASLESTADGILVVNRNGEIARWNRKFVELWRVPEELLVTDVKDPVLAYITSRMAQPDAFLAKVRELYEHPEASSQDLLTLADGRLFDRYSQPLEIGDEIVGRFWSYRDVTEHKKHQQEQLKIEKLESLGLLAGGIAHDFNNILTGVMGNVSFAQMFLDPSHKAFKPLAEAEKASLRATELAHQLLTFARGGQPIRKTISLQNIVNESVELVLSGSNVKGIVDIPDATHAVDADEGQLSQVLYNIIINASQAMPGGGTLTVSAQNETLADANAMFLRPGSYVRLTISDQGCGMPEEVMTKIFDPYFTTKSAGNGLGLASAYSIINKHGGNIGVDSAIGRGTTFTIHLPSIGETYSELATEITARGAAERHGGGSILVMDDDAMIRDFAAMMLSELGYRVMTCTDGAEAIRLYEHALQSECPFGAVIMDLTIPGGMGGKEAARQLLAVDAKAKLIVSSGYSNDPIMSDYPAYGFSAAVAKPYRINDLGQVLISLLGC